MDVKNNSAHLISMLTQTKDPKEIRQKLAAAADLLGLDRFRSDSAREIVARTQPERAIPDVYHPYRALVRDGIQFFLGHISFQRLLDVMVRQLQMDSQCTTEERLLELAKQFPTLHKLGQIIARNKNIDPGVKQWLIQLENGRYGTAPDALLSHINRRLESANEVGKIQLDSYILAEASVGAVIPFKWQENDDREIGRGVFKVLKPKIKAQLAEELTVFEKTAAYFEDHRHTYRLKNFKFLEVFKDVSQILKKEIDLSTEQLHLSEAARFFKGSVDIVIPALSRLSDDTMTAMTYIDGEKITDAQLTQAQRRHCANLLATVLICHPIFATQEPALFHGDPHAGNLLWLKESEAHHPRIALLDWSLAGHLSREVRIKIVGLMKSIIMDDHDEIYRCLQHLAGKRPHQKGRIPSRVRPLVTQWIRSEAYGRFSLLKKTFWLLEQLSYEGVVFPPDLMLFRKAIFTLEGVLTDLDAQFNLDGLVFKYVASMIADEMPRRIGRYLFLQSDKPEDYQSLLSNSDLQMILLNQYTTMIKLNTEMAVALYEKQAQIMRQLFN